MIIRPDQRQVVSEICRDELHQAVNRVDQRLREIESHQASQTQDEIQTVRKLYEELADKVWDDADEDCLKSLQDQGCDNIKQMIRDAFRHSSVIPIPSFAFLVSLSKRMRSETPRPLLASRNPDAVSAADREHLANILEERLQEAADTIIQKLGLNETRSAVVRDELDHAQSQIIGQFTPLA